MDEKNWVTDIRALTRLKGVSEQIEFDIHVCAWCMFELFGKSGLKRTRHLSHGMCPKHVEEWKKAEAEG